MIKNIPDEKQMRKILILLSKIEDFDIKEFNGSFWDSLSEILPNDINHIFEQKVKNDIRENKEVTFSIPREGDK